MIFGRILTLSGLRALFAILIALSLTLAPAASALASAQPGGQHESTVAADASADMSDCMRAMQGAAGSSKKRDCKCCDAQHKCPDTANCMTKCCKVIGAVRPAGSTIPLTTVAYRLAQPAKPPDWLNAPPFTPPRS